MSNFICKSYKKWNRKITSKTILLVMAQKIKAALKGLE